MRARLYDPRVARFISPDPVLSDVGWTQAHNRFSYVWNNPLKFVDPTGLEGTYGSDGVVTFEPETIVAWPPIMPDQPVGSEPYPDTIVPPPYTSDYYDDVTEEQVAAEPMAEFGPPPSTGSEWGERVQWDDPPVAHQSLAPKVGHEILSQPEFHGEDSSEFWESVLAWVTLPGAPELGIGAALTGVLGTVLTRVAPTAVRATKAINLPAWNKVTLAIKHIAERHIPGGPFTAGRTVFPSTMNEKGVTRAIREAYKNSTKVGVQGTDRVVLQGQGAGLTIEMWFNKVTNTIETAYPITR